MVEILYIGSSVDVDRLGLPSLLDWTNEDSWPKWPDDEPGSDDPGDLTREEWLAIG